VGRNSRVFDNTAPPVLRVVDMVIEESNEWIAAGFTAIASLLARTSF
jgi:hypothetical protein